MSKKRKLFIGCSRGAIHIAKWITSEIKSKNVDVDIVIWYTKKNWGNAKSTLESLTLMTKVFYYALFVYYPDDFIKLGKEDFFITRDNVIFESGLFFSKFGDKRTFILKPALSGHPANNEFRVLTDFNGIEFTYYKLLFDKATKLWKVDKTNTYTKENVDKLCNDIKEKEAEINIKKAVAENKILQVSNLIDADLRADNKADEFYLGNFAEKFDDLIRFKGIQSGKKLQNILTDVLISIKKIDDVLDIKQLAVEQDKSTTNTIEKIWVFADEPLEFKPSPTDKRLKEQFDKLKKTVVSNLTNGVKYVYFVNSGFDINNLQSLVGRQENLLKNIEVVKCDSKHFLTFFTLIFEKNNSNPTEIFVSLIDKNREDLLVKIPDNQKKKIFDNLVKIKGKSEVTPTYKVFDRVNH